MPAMQRIIDKTQTAFTKDRYILNSVICAQMIVHYVKPKKKKRKKTSKDWFQKDIW